jgi:dienelactone hydrolase
MSPDGNTLAWEDHSGPDSRVVMFDLRTHQYKRFLTIDPIATFRSITWADDETVLVTISFTKDLGAPRANWSGHDVRNWEVFRTIAADTSHTPGRLLLMSDDRRKTITGSDLVSWRMSKPKTVLMATLDIDYRWESQTPPAYSLFEVDTVTGKGRLVQRGTPLTTEWVADGAGRRVARKEVVGSPQGEFVVQVSLESIWRDIFHGKESDGLTLIGFSADGTDLVAVGVIGEGRRKLWRLPLDGSQPKVLFEDPDSDVEYVSVDSVTGAPRAISLGGAVPHARFLDPASQARADILDRSFPGQFVDEYDDSEASKRALVRVSGGTKPPVWYVVDFATHKADIVGEEYPALGSASLGERTVMSYKARDGQAIPAYLTLPPKSARQHLPLVVLVHGGPDARDFPGFDWWSQFLATRGYAVLQPQFRGSTGFGQAFRKAGYRQWGGLMQDDISDGVADLVSQGIADPQRVCIVGGSYGGYAALAGVAFTPTLYRCAVSVNGVSDIPEMLAYREHRHASLAYWQEHVGSQFDPVLKQKSPVHAAERINAPVLLLHASNDTVVPLSQSTGMAHALTAAHKSVQLVTLPGEDHWLSRSETRSRMLQEVEKFLAAHL